MTMLNLRQVGERVRLKRSYMYYLNSKGQLPEPDARCGCERNEPLWLPETIDQWDETRKQR